MSLIFVRCVTVLLDPFYYSPFLATRMITNFDNFTAMGSEGEEDREMDGGGSPPSTHTLPPAMYMFGGQGVWKTSSMLY